MFFVLDGPGYGPIAGLDAQAARSDGNQTDCTVELTLCARFCMQQSVQCLIPVHLMSTESPVWRESDFEQSNALTCGIFEQFPRNALNYRGVRDAVLGDGECLQHGLEITHLVKNLDMRIQPAHFARRELQIVLACNIQDGPGADGTLEMNMDFRLGKIVITGVEVFHVWAASGRISLPILLSTHKAPDDQPIVRRLNPYAHGRLKILQDLRSFLFVFRFGDQV